MHEQEINCLYANRQAQDAPRERFFFCEHPTAIICAGVRVREGHRVKLVVNKNYFITTDMHLPKDS